MKRKPSREPADWEARAALLDYARAVENAKRPRRCRAVDIIAGSLICCTCISVTLGIAAALATSWTWTGYWIGAAVAALMIYLFIDDGATPKKEFPK